MKLPLVSIVTPSFNQAAFLEETILSVLRQDYPSVEYIIIDGGSTDGSVKIIRKYEQHLAYWISEPDGGQACAVNKGFAQARGELLGWLCSDDLLTPSMVSLSAAYLKRDESIGMTYGDRVRIDRRGNIYSFQRYPSFRHYHLRFGLSLPQETSLFRREIFYAVGGLDESLQMALDYDLWCRLSRVSKLQHIPAYLGYFRSHLDNKSSNYSRQIQLAGYGEGYPAEFSKVYERYFGMPPSKIRARLGELLRATQAFVERRSAGYRREMSFVKDLRCQ